jgi:4-methyl-5(b-hydroxyethyl)-thiazole monophosphate biosynthesis
MINKKVLILLGNGFELIETSCFTDVLAWASFHEDVNIETVCVSAEPKINSAFGNIVLDNLDTIDSVNLEEFDALAIPGGMEWAGFFKSMYSDKFKRTISYFHAARKPIAAVCVASLALAKAGIIEGKRATIYHSESGKHSATLESYGVIFDDSPIAIDGMIITSSGPGTAVEVAIALVAKLTSKEISENTRQLMRVPSPPDAWYTPQVK